MKSCFSTTSGGPWSKMATLCLILTFLAICVQASLEAPPKLASCRDIYKPKVDTVHEYEIPYSCGDKVTFPLPPAVRVNATDPRNCDNYYTCTGLSCMHCPCPNGQAFDPKTLKCSVLPSECACPSQTLPSTQPTERSTTKASDKPVIISDNNAGNSENTGANNNDDEEGGLSSTEIIIIAAIISVTVIIVVIIVMAVFLWQRNRSRKAKRDGTPVKFSQQQSSMCPHHSQSNYARSDQPHEKHIYAEIDENKVWNITENHHQNGHMAPPVPSHQPPNATFCPIHHHSDSGVGSADTSFTSNYPKPVMPLVRYGGPFQGRQNEDLYNHSSCSMSSEYSQSSQQTSLDSHEVDVANLLAGQQRNAAVTAENYVSKHVYI